MKKSASNFRIVVLLLGCLIWSCKPGVNYNPKKPDELNYMIFEEYLSSPRLENIAEAREREKPGTGFEIHTHVHVEKNDSGTYIRWSPKQFTSAGYNKSLLAENIQKKLPLEIHLDSEGNVTSISGYNKLRATVDSMKLQDNYKQRLISKLDSNYFKDLWQDRWHISRFLPPGQYQTGQKLDTALLNPKLKSIKADSVVISAIRKKISSECLEYSVYYRAKRNLQLELEEFFVVHQKNLFDVFQFRMGDFFENQDKYGRVIKKGYLEEEEVNGVWRFSVTLDEGLPCYEFRKEELTKDIADSIETKLKVTFFRTIENGFKFY